MPYKLINKVEYTVQYSGEKNMNPQLIEAIAIPKEIVSDPLSVTTVIGSDIIDTLDSKEVAAEYVSRQIAQEIAKKLQDILVIDNEYLPETRSYKFHASLTVNDLNKLDALNARLEENGEFEQPEWDDE